MDSEGEDTGAPVACRPVQRAPAANVVDLRKHLSTAPSEYSYFRAGALALWAGPSHWKIKPFKGAVFLSLLACNIDGMRLCLLLISFSVRLGFNFCTSTLMSKIIMHSLHKVDKRNVYWRDNV
jgi:hypothetical protein